MSLQEHKLFRLLWFGLIGDIVDFLKSNELFFYTFLLANLNIMYGNLQKKIILLKKEVINK